MLKKAISSSLFLLALTLLGFSSPASATDVPEWLRNLARQPQKNYADDVNAVILLDDNVTIVKDNGDLVRRGRRVLRILRPEGRERAATYWVEYNADSKVNYLRGWSITPKGQEYETKTSDVSEHSISTYEVYSDAKIKALRVPGAVVGTGVCVEYEPQ